ncbi:MAG TPA: aminomethyltransferase beta-barrel domain-containing protein, partial [Gaiella sp.]|nr:aminomethyltransferase beta-barrel domain-containing protein [Gaiella sp.]
TSNEPLFALRSDVGANTLVVGPRHALGARRVEARGRLYLAVDEVEVKVRHRSEPVPARVTSTETGFELALARPVEAVAPGQVAVLYEDDVVVGAGVIERATG